MRFLLGLLGVCLLQTAVVSGVNSSMSDFVLVALLFSMAGSLVVPRSAALSFLGISFVTLLTASLITPASFGTDIDHIGILVDFSKLLMAFLWFTVGFGIARIGKMGVVIRWFSWMGLLVSATGAAISLSRTGILRDQLFMDGVRFHGLVNDPNLCAVLLVASLPYFLDRASISASRKFLVFAVVLLGVGATGSKTGLAILVAYSCIFTLRALARAWRRGEFSRIAVLGLLVATVGLAVASSAGSGLDQIAQLSPEAGRSISAITDSESALNGNGSGRGEAFSTALQIVQASPILGVGVGSYSLVAVSISGSPVIAHNTYLQLASEWGLPLAMAFFVAVFALLAASPRGSSDTDGLSHMMRDMCYVMLLGGLSISLNNVRLFWLLLGALLAVVTMHRASTRGPDSEAERYQVDALDGGGTAPLLADSRR